MERTVKTDTSVKILVGLIAVALFANLLRPALTPTPAQAAPGAALAAGGGTALALEPGVNQAIVVNNGTVYEVDFQNAMKINAQVRLK